MRRVMSGLLLLFLVALPAFAGRWETGFEKAKETAQAESKFLLLNFTGSDWCGWCMKLDEEVFSKPAFKRFAKKNLVCVELDFPRGKPLKKSVRDQNKALATQFGVGGYPTILLLKADGTRVAKTGYRKGGAAPYVEHLEELLKPARAEQPAPASSAGGRPGTERIWTDYRGRKVTGALVSKTASSVTLRTADGKDLTIGRSTLSAGDRIYLSTQ